MTTIKILTTLTAIALTVPAIADPITPNISANANSANCTETVLETTSGTSNLEANWTANTLNLEWYDDTNGNKITPNNNAANTCTYDSGITVPSNQISKTGYTFAGWSVKAAAAPVQPQQTTITLSSLYGSGDINVFASKSLNPGVYCEGSSGGYYNGDDAEYVYYWYGNTGGGSCSDSGFSGLNNGEWTVTMPNGDIVKGEARCSTVEGSYAQTGNPTDDLDLNNLNNGAEDCWCKATSGNTGSGFQSVASSSWVFIFSDDGATDCANYCAARCASYVAYYDICRAAVFGAVQ